MANIFSNIWNTGKKAVTDVGHFVGKVGSNPLVLGGLSLIPGVGIPTAAAIGGISGLIKPGGNIGQGLKGAATGAAAGAAGKLISKIPGVGSTIGKIPGISDVGKFIGGIPGLGAVGSALGKIPGVQGLEQFLGGGGGDSAGGGTDWRGIARDAGILGLGGLQAANAASLGKKSNEYATAAMDAVNQSYGERGLLRAAGVGGMLHPQTADLSGLLSHSGPYATGLSKSMPALPQKRVASVGSYV